MPPVDEKGPEQVADAVIAVGKTRETVRAIRSRDEVSALVVKGSTAQLVLRVVADESGTLWVERTVPLLRNDRGMVTLEGESVRLDRGALGSTYEGMPVVDLGQVKANVHAFVTVTLAAPIDAVPGTYDCELGVTVKTDEPARVSNPRVRIAVEVR
jgi:nitrous oxidase accessory protein NosD